tara:strand:+ start:203 stop:415 length:213 start_codon:yes stop_codon:yes gene_type:complete
MIKLYADALKLSLKGFPKNKFVVVYKRKQGGEVETLPSYETTPRRAYDSILRAHPQGYVIGVIKDHRFVA